MKELELNKIHNIDCLEFMKTLPDKCIDLVLTDPPYDLDNGGTGKSFLTPSIQKISTGLSEIENGFNYKEVFKELERICSPLNIFMFCSNKQITTIMNWGESLKDTYTTLLVWHKTNSTPFANNVWRGDIEYCVHIREKGAFFEGGAEIKKKVSQFPMELSKLHPTVKPLDLIAKYLKIGSKENDVIFDPFLGSGTTAIACKMLNRNYIGCEISPEYCKIAEERINSISNTLF